MNREELARAMWEAAEKAPGQGSWNNPYKWDDAVMENVRNRYLAAADVALRLLAPEPEVVARASGRSEAREDLAFKLRRAIIGADYVEPWDHWADQVKEQWLRVADEAIEARVRVLEETARAVPVDLWATYGRAPRATVEGFQKWLTDRAARMRRGETPHGH